MSANTQAQQPSDYYTAIPAGSSATRQIIESPTPPPNSTAITRETISASKSANPSFSEFRPTLLSRSSFNYAEAEARARADSAIIDGQDDIGDDADSKNAAGDAPNSSTGRR